MKLCYLLGLFLLGVLVKADEDVSEDTSLEDTIYGYGELKEVLQKKCKEVGGDEAYHHLKEAVKELKTCLDSHLPSNTDELQGLQEDPETSNLCELKRESVRECFNGHVIEALENCAQPDEKFIPHFLFDAVDDVLNYICADEEAFIMKVIKSLPCMHIIVDNNSTATCDADLKVLDHATPEDLKITKDEICHDLKYAKTCYGEVITKECPDSPLKELGAELYAAVNAACEKKHKRSIPRRFRL